MKNNTTKDNNGNIVRTGDFVRVIAFNFNDISKLDKDEQTKINSMLGGEFQIEEIDDHGSAWITKWWELQDGTKESHSLALSPKEMEKIAEKS